MSFMIISLVPSIYRNIASLSHYYDNQEEVYIAVKQLCQYAMGSRYLSIGQNYIFVDRQEENIEIVNDHHRIVKKPGFEILLDQIDNLEFYNENGFIYMGFIRQDKPFRFLIANAIEMSDSIDKDE